MNRSQKQRRLREVESLARTLEEVRAELAAYREALCRKLELLPQLPDTQSPARIGQMFQKLLAGPMGHKPAAAAGSDRRTSRRRAGNPISIFISNDNGTTDPIPGWVTDRSMTGLGLWVDQEEPVGTVLRLRPVKTKEPDWSAQVVVRHCRAERGRYVVGCQYVSRLAWNELKVFG